MRSSLSPCPRGNGSDRPRMRHLPAPPLEGAVALILVCSRWTAPVLRTTSGIGAKTPASGRPTDRRVVGFPTRHQGEAVVHECASPGVRLAWAVALRAPLPQGFGELVRARCRRRAEVTLDQTTHLASLQSEAGLDEAAFSEHALFDVTSAAQSSSLEVFKGCHSQTHGWQL